MNVKEQITFSFALIVLVIGLGTTGYTLIEGWPVFDALYMTVITITTIGYMEVHPLTYAGRWFTVALVFTSVGTVFYVLTNAARLLIEGEIRGEFWRRKLKDKIRKLRGHYIVCGYGRMGRIVCKELRHHGARFVVLEKNPAVEAEGEGLLLMPADATKDESLKEAGIEYAKGLISVLPSDAENLYVVLSARGLNPTLEIVARAVEEGSEQKLLRAGANRVVSPYFIGGLRIAHTLLKPTVVDFIEFTTSSGDIELQMEELRVGEGSELIGKSLAESGIGRQLAIIIVAIKKRDGKMRVNPTHRAVIDSGDIMVVIGEPDKMKLLENMAAGPAQ